MVEKPKTPLCYENMDQLKKEADKTKNLRNKNPKSLAEMIPKLYSKAHQALNSGDEELSYIYFMRCLSVILCLKESPDFQTFFNYYRAMYAKEANDCMAKLQELDASLRARYNDNQQPIPSNAIIDEEGKLNDELDVSFRCNGFASSTVSNDDEGRAIAEEENEKISITSGKLYQLAAKSEPYSVLIIDLRPKPRFIQSHIKLHSVINVPPDIITSASVMAKRLVDKLDDKFKPAFIERTRYNKLVLLDEKSTMEDFNPDNILYRLYTIFTKWDPGVNYRNKLFILHGGFADWLHCYPQFTTNSRYELYMSDVTTTNDLDTVSYPLSESSFELLNRNLTANGEVGIGKFQTVKLPPLCDRSKKPSYDKLMVFKFKENHEFVQQDKEEQDGPPISSSTSMFRSPSITSLASEHEMDIDAKTSYHNTRRYAISPANFEPNSPVVNDKENTNNLHKDRESPSNGNEDSSSGAMKKSLSTPNISQIKPEDDTTNGVLPEIDRSSKPRPSNHYGITTLHSNENIRLTGLKNLGNTCYMNSIIQCLSNTQRFKDKLLSSSFIINPKSKTAGEIAEEMKNIIRQLHSGESISCKHLKNLVGKQRSIFRGYDQQDSHEFFTILIDCIHEDLNHPRSFAILDGADEKSGEKAWGEFISQNNSIVRELFYGQQKSTIMCRLCKEESVTFEPFSNLSLPLPNTADSCTLAACFRLYLQEETISEWMCPKCKELRAASKKLDIARLPPILVLHFKRFTSEVTCKKKMTYVDFTTDTLDMTPFMLHGEHRNRVYDLYAVSNHYGSIESGHYTAYCKTYKGWFKFDDQDVNPLSRNDIKSSEAYILFYTSIRAIR